MLAVLIRNPSYYDPAAHPQEAQDALGRRARRHGRPSTGCPPADRAASAYPPVLPHRPAPRSACPTGPEGLVVSQAIKELEAKGYTDEQIHSGGLRITTTVQKKDEDAAINAVNTVMKGQPSNIDKRASAPGAGRGRPEDRRRCSPTTAARRAPGTARSTTRRPSGSPARR